MLLVLLGCEVRKKTLVFWGYHLKLLCGFVWGHSIFCRRRSCLRGGHNVEALIDHDTSLLRSW